MQPRAIALALADLLRDHLANRAEPHELAERLRTLADDLAPPASQTQLRLVPALPLDRPSPRAKESEAANARDVFAYWQRVLAKPRALFTKERQGKVQARLREGYTVAQICQAIDACAASAFHRGENEHHREYVDLTLICQTGSKLEQFLEMGGAPPTRAVADSPVGELEELRRVASEQLRSGDPGYQATQQKIKALRARLG